MQVNNIMEADYMHLKILLPFRIYLEDGQVVRINCETRQGHYGLLPNRLDCVAALVPGILTFETVQGKTENIAIDEGLLVKTDDQVIVAVRNAIGGVPLGQLRSLILQKFKQMDETEEKTRSVLAKLESNFIHEMEKFRNR